MIKAGFDPSRISSRQFAPGEVQDVLVVKKAETTTDAAEEAWRRHNLITRLAMSVCRIWDRQHPHSTNPSLLLDMFPNPKDAAEAIGFEILDRIEKRKKWIKEISAA